MLPVGEDGWNIIEVKSATQVKDVNIHDVSFQKYVYEKAGLKIRNCILMHINNQYVRKGEIEPKELFIQAEINDKVEEFGEGIEKRIEGYKGGFFNLTGEEIINKNFFPKFDKEYYYIELSNVSGNGEINVFTKDLGANLPTRARRKLKEGDVIISSIQGSLSSCALITKDYENCLCSNGFFVLNSKKLNPETLLVLSKALIIQKLLERGCRGTILTAIGKDELQKIKIPLLPLQIQSKISSKIQESFKLRKESKELLERAKKMVENEIEKESAK